MASNGLNLDDLQIKIRVSTGNATRSIHNLINTIEELRTMRIDGLNMLIRQLDRLNERSYMIRTLADSIRSLSTELNRIGVNSQNLANVTRAANVQEVTGETERAAQAVTDAGEACDQCAESAQNVGKQAEEAGKRAEKAAKGGLAQFFASVKRIAMYRAIRSAMKFLTQAIREGFEMFVTWDREQNNYMAGTAANVEKLTEKWTILKGQMGALGGVLLNSLAPVITKIIELFTKLVDIIQMVVRSLQGEYTYYKLIYQSAKATTGQAKELKRILFGFDELNVLTQAAGGGTSGSAGNWAYELVPINNGLLNGIADLSRGFQNLIGYSDDWRKSLGLLVGVIGLLLGAKAIGGLISVLPRLISLFKGKNQTLQEQTTSTAAEAAQVGVLAGAFGGALLAAKKLKDYFDTNPMSAKVGMAVDYSQMSTIPTVLTAMQAFLKMNPLTFGLTAPFKALASAFESFRNTIQTYFNNNPISIATKAAGGAATGYGYKTSGALAKNFENYVLPATSMTSTAQTVSQAMTMAFEEYEANGWRDEWLGTDAAKIVGTVGAATLGTAVAAIAGVGAALAEFFSSLGLQSILGFANGGVPDTGTLFYAGEAGAEVVANMGHSTGVMNMSQMEAAVANGNVEVINAIYQMANMITGAVNNKNFDVYLDTQKVGKSVSQYQLNYARAMGV